MVAQGCEAPEHGSMPLLTWRFGALVIEHYVKANTKHAVEGDIPKLW